jgi:hypothetical protein
MSLFNCLTDATLFSDLPAASSIKITPNDFDVVNKLSKGEQEYYEKCKVVAGLKTGMGTEYLTAPSVACVYLAFEVRTNTLQKTLLEILDQYAVIFNDTSKALTDPSITTQMVNTTNEVF